MTAMRDITAIRIELKEKITPSGDEVAWRKQPQSMPIGMNFVFSSGESYPIAIEKDDMRFMALEGGDSA